VPDGTTCDDGDAATLNDACSVGVCRGARPDSPGGGDPIPEESSIGEFGYLMFDFEDYFSGEDPLGWLDTGRNNSIEEADHFRVFALDDGGRAFGTTSKQRNIHSHYVGLDSHGWFDYEFRGRMMIDTRNAGVGVTIYSDYPASDSYYRLRSYSGRAFHLANHPHREPESVCVGATKTSLRPTAGVWYHFRLQAFDDQTETRVRAKVWPETEPEPEGWEIDCNAPGDTAYFSGSPGLWSMSAGGKFWDDLELVELDESDLP
jgi:hypothetical protein